MYKKNTNFFVEESEDSIILYNNDNNEKLLVLNEIGSLIFNEIDKLDISEIIERIITKYEVNEDELRKDIEVYINNLMKLQIIYKE